MKQIHVPAAAPMDYRAAAALAAKYAGYDGEMEEPVLIAWHDRRHGLMSPAIAGANPDTRWRDYGNSHCGCLEVDVGDDFEFVFTDGAPYADYGDCGPGPYRNFSDSEGRQYLCDAHDGPGNGSLMGAVCVPLDEYTSKLT